VDPIEAQLKQIVSLIQEEDYSSALDRANEVIAAEGHRSDGHVLRGIALANLNRRDDATQAFRRALAIAPLNSKALYNYALHLYESGDLVQAESVIGTLLESQPNHASGLDLRAVIRSERTEPDPAPVETEVAPVPEIAPVELDRQDSAFAHGLPVAPTAIGYVRPSASDDQPRLSYIESAQPWWDRGAWAVAVASMGLTAPRIASLVHMFSETGGKISRDAFMTAFWAGGNPILGWIRFLVMAGTIVWMAMEVMNRRKQPSWLVAATIAGFLGMEWAVLAVYLLVGRNES